MTDRARSRSRHTHRWLLSAVLGLALLAAVPLFIMSAHTDYSPSVSGASHAVLLGLPAGTLIWLLLGVLALVAGAVVSVRGKDEEPSTSAGSQRLDQGLEQAY